jgi:hypothetical protein
MSEATLGWAECVELWDRAAELPAFARHSPQALPASVRRAWHVDEDEPSFRGAPPRLRLELASGATAGWDFMASEVPTAERRALVEGELTLSWDGSVVGRVRLATNAPRRETTIDRAEPEAGPDLDPEARRELRELLETLRAQEAARREGQQAWREMRQQAARPYLPRKD